MSDCPYKRLISHLRAKGTYEAYGPFARGCVESVVLAAMYSSQQYPGDMFLPSRAYWVLPHWEEVQASLGILSLQRKQALKDGRSWPSV